MLYFAYGANLDAMQMRLRCPSARAAGKARLEDYRFCFPLWSRIRQSGLISIEPADGERVWGLLYEVRESDLPALDLREGYDVARPARNTVSRQSVRAIRGRGKTVTAETYVARAGVEARLPSADYIAYLVHLAADRGLPEEYRARLRAVRVAALAA